MEQRKSFLHPRLFLGCFLIVTMLVVSGCGEATSPPKQDVVQASPNPSSEATKAITPTDPTEAPTELPDVELEDETEVALVSVTDVAFVGETMDYKGLQITFDRVEYYVDKSQYVMDKAKAGHKFLILWFTVSNTTDKDDFLNFFFEDSYCDDFAIEPVMFLFNMEGEMLWGNVAAGRKAKGYVAYEIPDQWEVIEFMYKPNFFLTPQDKMTFRAFPSDIETE